MKNALEVIKNYQNWRRWEIESQLDPKEIGEALDWLIAEIEGGRQAFNSLSEKMEDMTEKYDNLKRNYQESLKQIRSLSNAKND